MKLHTSYQDDGVVRLLDEEGLIVGVVYTGLTTAKFICRKVNNLEVNADILEEPESRMCDCSVQEGNIPISPATGLPMTHHCECRAVLASETLRRGESRTLHARACSPIPDRVHP